MFKGARHFHFAKQFSGPQLQREIRTSTSRCSRRGIPASTSQHHPSRPCTTNPNAFKLLASYQRCILSRNASTSTPSSPSASSKRTKSQRRKWTYRQQTFLNTKDCTSVEQVVALTMDNIKNLTPGNYSAIWVRISQLLLQSNVHSRNNENAPTQHEHGVNNQKLEQQLKRILYKTIRSAEDLSPKHLSGIILALSKMAQRARRSGGSGGNPMYNLLLEEGSKNQEDVFHQLLDAAQYRLDKFEPRYLSNLSYSCALLRIKPNIIHEDETLLDRIASEAIEQIRKFNSQDLSNMVWAYANLLQRNPPLFDAVGNTIAASTNLRSFNPQDFSNIVWSFATLRQEHLSMFQCIGDRIEAHPELIKRFKPQEICNTLWAFATLHADHGEMFERVGDCIAEEEYDLNRFTSQNLSNLVWAYATRGEEHLQLFKKVGVAVAGRDLKSFKPQALANIVWAFASSGVVHLGMFNCIGDTIAKYDDLKAFKPHEVRTIAGSFKAVNVDHPELFAKVEETGISLER